MIVLGIEGSRLPACVALLQIDEEEGSVEVGGIALIESGDLSGSLLHAIEAVLENVEASLDDVSALAVGTGPGSWTGLRVTLSLAKTLAQTRELALLGVPSFDAMAQAVWRSGLASGEGEEEAPTADDEDEDVTGHRMVLAVAECRPGELYGKVFEASGEYIVPAQEEWIAAPRELLDAAWTQALSRGIEAPPLIVAASGDGALDVMKAACHELNEEAAFAAIEAPASAVEVAIAGLERLAQGEADDPLALAPIYVAPSAAERNLFGG